MAINFPNSPLVNDVFTASANTWSYDGEKWVLVSDIINLDDLGDVSASAPTAGEFLKYDGINWVPDTIPTINALDDIGDVSVFGASASQVLTYNGTNWVAADAVAGFASDSVDGGILSPEILEAEVTNYIMIEFDGGML